MFLISAHLNISLAKFENNVVHSGRGSGFWVMWNGDISDETFKFLTTQPEGCVGYSGFDPDSFFMRFPICSNVGSA